MDKWLNRVIDGLGKAGIFFASLSILGMFIPIAAGAISRYIFNKPFNWIDEYGGALMIPCIFLSLLYVLRKDKHIRVNIIVSRLPHKVAVYLGMFNSLLTAGYATFLCLEGIRMTKELIHYNVGYMNFEVPMYVPIMCIPIGAGMFGLGCIALFISQLRAEILGAVEEKNSNEGKIW